MNLLKRAVTLGALLLFPLARVQAQIVERPVPFDSAGLVTVMTPYLADRASLRPPWWPVSGEFTDARLFTANDSTYVLAVTRRTGVVERYSLSGTDREAIRAVVSRLPRETVMARTDARGAFIRGQTFLGLLVYGPAFAGAIGDNSGTASAGYLVVAGGTFFAASEVSRRMFISRPQADLSTNMGLNGALAGWATAYLLNGGDKAQFSGAFIGGITGAAIGVRAARNMTEADAVSTGWGSDIGALIAYGTMEAIRGKSDCTFDPATSLSNCTSRRLSDRSEVAIVLASGIIGYPLGLLYPRNARYSVTAGDVETLAPATALGAGAGIALLGRHASYRQFATLATVGGVLGMMAGDRFLVRRYDHDRDEAGRLSLGTAAGALIGAGIAALSESSRNDPHIIGGLAVAGGLTGLIVTERYLRPNPDAGRPRFRVTFNPASIPMLAARTPGNHSLLNVRF
ncbi:MAG TPA: hypothetical protein VK478_04740 [Gemmatimonadaceae bacterium]|nr:hypothetical protein [Gemmatimonadaceae bacterium]